MGATHAMLWLAAAGCTPDEGDTRAAGQEDTAAEVDPNLIEYPGGFVSLTTWELSDYMGSLPVVRWLQEADAPVTIAYQDADGAWQSVAVSATAGDNAQILVGLPFGAEAEWTITPDGEDTFDGATIRTADVPEGFPALSVTASEPDRWLPEGRFFLSSVNAEAGGWTGGAYWTFIIDRQGRLHWASPAPDRNWTLFAQVAVSRDHILWDEATYWSQYDHGEASRVHRTYLDAELDVIDTPGLHHAFVQKPDGALAWGSQLHDETEALVELPLGGTPDDVDVIWTCQASWPRSGQSCESNGLFFHEETNSYLYSFYTNDAVVEVDQATGQSLWWAGGVPGGYSFSPEEAQFMWQHGVSYTDDGTLLLSSEAHINGTRRTVAREYAVDHDSQQLVEVWSFNSGVFASTNGDTWRLDNGNTLHVVGSSGYLMEATADAEIVWQVSFGGTHLLGRGELIEDLWSLVSPEGQPR